MVTLRSCLGFTIILFFMGSNILISHLVHPRHATRHLNILISVTCSLLSSNDIDVQLEIRMDGCIKSLN